MSELTGGLNTRPVIALSPTLLAAVAAATALALFLITLPQTITLEDAGLFQMVCHLNGLSHPPGYPLFTLLCQTLTVTPTVFNGNLISAIFGALTIGVFTLILSSFITQRSIVVISALAYAGSLTFWSQSIIIEVYTLAALLFYACWLCIACYIRTNDRRWWYLSCLIFSLSLANHWPLALLSTPALIALAWHTRARLTQLLFQPAAFGVCLLMLIAGLTPYISLLTASPDVFGVFGPINNWQEFLQYVVRGLYDDTKASADLSDRLAFFQWLPLESIRQLGPLASAIAAFGVYASFRSGPTHIAVAVLLNYVGATFVLTALLGFEFDRHGQSIFLPYPIIAYGSLAIWFAFGLQAIYQLLARISPKAVAKYLPPVLALAVLATILHTNYRLNNRQQDTWVENYFVMLLETLPENAVLFTEGDILSFPLGYLHHVRQVRPDVTLYNWYSLTYPNRLTPVFATTQEKESAIVEFVSQTRRPVFVIKPTLSPLVSYGIYNKVQQPGEPAAILLPEVERWLDLMLDRFEHSPPTRQQELELLEFIFAGFTRTYLAHQAEMMGNGLRLKPQRSQRLARLMKTFTGKMMLLEQALAETNQSAGQDQPRTLLLRQMVAEAATQIPTHVTNVQRARYYYYAARTHLLSPVEPEAARALLQYSIKLNPSVSNPAGSLLSQLDAENDTN